MVESEGVLGRRQKDSVSHNWSVLYKKTFISFVRLSYGNENFAQYRRNNRCNLLIKSSPEVNYKQL